MDAFDDAKTVAEAVLASLGPEAPALRVRDVEWDDPYVRVWIAKHQVVLFRPEGDLDESVWHTAGQIQDAAIEETWGAALPPCPGHPHPLSARLVGGVASWVCPRDENHHVQPILRLADLP